MLPEPQRRLLVRGAAARAAWRAVANPHYGPRLFTFDFSFLKRTKVTEKTNLEFRWEIFNLFNNANFNIPDTDITSLSFGQVLSTVTQPRLMQVALRFNW